MVDLFDGVQLKGKAYKKLVAELPWLIEAVAFDAYWSTENPGILKQQGSIYSCAEGHRTFLEMSMFI